MTNLDDLTASQLHCVIAIKERIEKLQSELHSIESDGGQTLLPSKVKRRRLSAAGRSRIAAAARARWARFRGTRATAPTPASNGQRRFSAAGPAAEAAAQKRDRRRSPAVKAKLAAIARARWAKIRAAGKTRL
jgi:hypothetical protein